METSGFFLYICVAYFKQQLASKTDWLSGYKSRSEMSGFFVYICIVVTKKADNKNIQT